MPARLVPRLRRPFGDRPRPLIVGVLLGAIVTFIAMVLIAPVLLLTHRSDWPMERWYAQQATGLVTSLRMDDRKEPLPTDPQLLGRARFTYSTSCAFCHGMNGDGKGPQARSHYPPPTDFTSERSKDRSDEHLYWVIEHGLAYTSMGSYAQFTDEQTWAMVAYIRLLQQGQGESVPRITPTPTTAPAVATPAATGSPAATATPAR